MTNVSGRVGSTAQVNISLHLPYIEEWNTKTNTIFFHNAKIPSLTLHANSKIKIKIRFIPFYFNMEFVYCTTVEISATFMFLCIVKRCGCFCLKLIDIISRKITSSSAYQWRTDEMTYVHISIDAFLS